MSIRPIFAWYDLWVGLFWDAGKRRLYVFPIPCFGVVLQFKALARSNPPQEERSDPLDLAAADDNRPDIPRDEEGRDAYQIIADCNRQAMLRRAGAKDRSREPLLGPPSDMLVSRILLEALPDIDPKRADQLAVKIADAIPADDNHKALVEAATFAKDALEVQSKAAKTPSGLAAHAWDPESVAKRLGVALAPFTTKETDHG